MSDNDRDRALRVDHLHADLVGRSVRGGAIVFGAQAVKVAVQFGTVILLSRLLEPRAFGLLAMVAALTEILDQLKDFGLSTATIQRPDITHRQVTALFWINVAIGAVLALGLVALAPWIAVFYGQPELGPIACWLGLGFLLSGMTTQHWALLRRQMRFGATASIDVGAEVTAMAVAVVAALYGAGYWALVVQRLTYVGLVLVGSWSLAGWWPGLPRRCAGLGKLIGFGSSVTGNNIVALIARNLDQVLIGWFWGPHALGFYERAYKLLMVPINNVTAPIYSVGLPMLSRLRSEPERYRRAYLDLAEKLAMASMPAAALVLACADWIVAVLLGPQWHDAAPILRWLALAAVPLPVSYATGLLFVSQERGRDLLTVGTIGATLSATAIVIGLPFGPEGVAACFALSATFLRAPMGFWLAGRKGPVRTSDLYRTILPSIVAAVAVLGLIVALRRTPFLLAAEPLIGLLTVVPVGVVAALACFAILPRSRRAILSLRRLTRAARLGKAGA
jgi:polysaccharide transporter, PST family